MPRRYSREIENLLLYKEVSFQKQWIQKSIQMRQNTSGYNKKCIQEKNIKQENIETKNVKKTAGELEMMSSN